MSSPRVSASAFGRGFYPQSHPCDHGHIALVEQGYKVSDRQPSRNGRAASVGSSPCLPFETRGPSWRTNRRAVPRGPDSCDKGVPECI